MIEMLMASVLVSFLIGVAFLSLEMGIRSKQTGETEIILQQNARKAMREMVRELRESDASTVSVYPYTDPQNNEIHDALAFASARGDATASPEGTCVDNVGNNACFHVDVTGNPRWRSLVVYAPYEHPDGRKELRRYVSYNANYGGGSYFPFTFTSITLTEIRLKAANGIILTLSRAGSAGNMRVLAEHIATEDTNNNNLLDPEEDDGNLSSPFDNADGVLNRGADFGLSGGVVTIDFFLKKRDTSFPTSDRYILSTLRGSAEMRN